MDESSRILVLNPGSTSTKLSVFLGLEEERSHVISHSAAELCDYARVVEQEQFRFDLIKQFLSTGEQEFAAVIGRGGLLKPVESGVYRVNSAMLEQLRAATHGEHASNLGAILAHRFAELWGCEALIADPVVVDELEPAARLSGLPEITRRSVFHALNQKSAAREVATALGKRYEQCNMIVAHLGGGVSVGAHRRGRVIDVNNALNGDGPFSPERAGGLPAAELAELARTMPAADLARRTVGGGGLVAYCGTNKLQEARERADAGDCDCGIALEAMTLQISQEITKHGATLKGEVDAIVLTGGMAHDELLVEAITERVRHLAAVHTIAGEREMLSLARAALRALNGEEPVREYA